MKISKLNGSALDWAVAKAWGVSDADINVNTGHPVLRDCMSWRPSTNWVQGGAIIEQEKIAIDYSEHDNTWCAAVYDADGGFSASTPLVAAMRSFVASKFGNDIEVPEELV